jgi:chaperonin cofactor prefoldin
MATNLDRGSNDLEEIIDRLEKQKQFLKLKLEQASSKIQKLKHANAIFC